MTSILDDDVQVRGSLSVLNAFYPPAGAITNSAFTADPSQRLSAAKVERALAVDRELFDSATSIAAATKTLHYVFGSTGTLVDVTALIFGAATGDRTASVDIKKSTAGGAFATILTTPIAISSATVVRTALAAAIASAGLVEGDILQVVVAVGGSTGTQPAGLHVTLTIKEDPS